VRNFDPLIEKLLASGVKNPDDLARVKRRMAKEHRIPCPSNVALLKIYHEMVKKGMIKKSEKIAVLLRTRPIRSLSGIVNVSVLTKPYSCPGQCLYCPAEKGIPKSYVSGEPAVERARALNYDPYLQVKKRIEMLETEGHPTDKIELIIKGGTWNSYPLAYQYWFVARSFEGANDFYKIKKIQRRKKQTETPKNVKIILVNAKHYSTPLLL